jgi:transposase
MGERRWETDQNRMAAMMIGFPDARVLSVSEDSSGVHVEVETAVDRARCSVCGEHATLEGTSIVERPSPPAFGRPVLLAWRVRRWACPKPGCSGGSWLEEVPKQSVRSDRPKQ